MAVLLYQLGIFIAIQIAAAFGRKSRNTAVVLITIFTFLQVFISPLLLLQLITIYISYGVSQNSTVNKIKSKIQEVEPVIRSNRPNLLTKEENEAKEKEKIFWAKKWEEERLEDIEKKKIDPNYITREERISSIELKEEEYDGTNKWY